MSAVREHTITIVTLSFVRLHHILYEIVFIYFFQFSEIVVFELSKLVLYSEKITLLHKSIIVDVLPLPVFFYRALTNFESTSIFLCLLSLRHCCVVLLANHNVIYLACFLSPYTLSPWCIFYDLFMHILTR